MENKRYMYIEASVIIANTEELYSIAASRGIEMPHPALGIFKSVLAPIETPNANKVRLGEKGTLLALPSLIGCQINFSHTRKGAICGHIIDAEINKNKEIEIVCIFFKSVYPNEYAKAMELFKENKLTMSFELDQDADTQDLLPDGTRRVNDYYFTGAGLLGLKKGEKPAYNKARVFEMATEKLQEEIFAIREETLMSDNKQFNKNKITEVLLKLTKEAQEIVATEEEAAKWTTAYINTLPDSSFAVIEPAYKKGETKDKNARHLPFKDADGKIDLPHYRNALARVNQIKPVTDSITTEELRRQASAELEKHRSVLKTEKAEDMEQEIKTEESKCKAEAQVCPECKEPIDKEDNECSVCKQKKTEKAEEVKTEEIKVEEVKPEEAQIVRTEKTEVENVQVITNTETMEQTVITHKQEEIKEQDQVVRQEQTVSVVTYSQPEMDAVKAELATLKETVLAKDKEIESLKANMDTVIARKVELASNEFAKEFKTEDYLDDNKIQAVKAQQERKETLSKIKEELKANAFAKDFTDEDYLNADKVENAKLKQELANKPKVVEQASVQTPVLETGHVKLEISSVDPLVSALKNKRKK